MGRFRVPIKDKAFKLVIFGLATAACLVCALLSPPKALADTCTGLYSSGGRNCDQGFYYNRTENSGKNVFEGGIYVYNLNDFLNAIRSKMACSGNTLSNQNDQGATGSSFIILTMLGYPAGTSKNMACQQYGRWAGLVTQYDQAGLIDWNRFYSWEGNTFYQPANHDVAWEAPNAPTFTGSDYTISFSSPDGTGSLYVIKHFCANPVGKLRALKPVNRPPTGNLTAASCTALTGNAVDPDTPNKALTITSNYARTNGVAVATLTSSTNAGSHAFSGSIPAAVRNSVYPLVVHTYARDTTTNKPYELTGSPRTFGPCLIPKPQCYGVSVAATLPDSNTPLDPNTPFTVTANVAYRTTTEADAIRQQTPDKFYLKLAGPGVNYNNPNVQPVKQAGNILTVVVNFARTGQTGTYALAWGISGDVGTINCGSTTNNGAGGNTFPVVDLPYFQVKNGDISAGSGMDGPAAGSSCSLVKNTLASIVSWNREAAGGYAGAGTTYAAFALNRLQDFASGQGGTLAPSRLSFANASTSIGLDASTFGGNYGGGNCAKNEFVDRAGTTIYNTTYTLPASYATITGQTPTLYVKGNVYINHNVIYANTGNYGNVGAIPSFSMVVQGNIFIDNSVTQLDGVYTAQPDGSGNGGRIYDCSPGPNHFASPVVFNANIYNNCNNQLTFNGAVIAAQLWLLRTHGTLTTDPAEQFNYTPETWLTSPFTIDTTGKADNYNAITSLPPEL